MRISILHAAMETHPSWIYKVVIFFTFQLFELVFQWKLNYIYIYFVANASEFLCKMGNKSWNIQSVKWKISDTLDRNVYLCREYKQICFALIHNGSVQIQNQDKAWHKVYKNVKSTIIYMNTPQTQDKWLDEKTKNKEKEQRKE